MHDIYKNGLTGGNLASSAFCDGEGAGVALVATDKVLSKDWSEMVLEAITSKHSNLVEPGEEILEDCAIVPEMVVLDLVSNTVAKVASKLLGVVGLVDGFDGIAAVVGMSSNLLCEVVAPFTRWIANCLPLMAGQYE